MRFFYDAKQRPTLPVSLRTNEATYETIALVDSGADVNVLPWGIGLRLGLVWNPNKATIRVAGASAGKAAMPVLLTVDFGEFRGITQAFAWCRVGLGSARARPDKFLHGVRYLLFQIAERVPGGASRGLIDLWFQARRQLGGSTRWLR